MEPMPIDKMPLAQEQVVEATTLLQIIANATMNPSINIEKLLEFRERELARIAKTAFFAAFAKMQPELPTIDRNGHIVITEKGRPQEVIQSTPYALYEDITDAVRPIIAKHGFSIFHREGVAADGKITVTAILGHENGHTEETMFTSQHDSTGSKNAVQAHGSTLQYGRRYTTIMILNITSRAPKDPRDDNGTASGARARITEEQAEEIKQLIVDTGSNLKIFFNYFGCASIEELPASKYDLAVKKLKAKQARNGG